MIGKLAWKNIWFKPLNTILSILLLTASVAIITVLILVQKPKTKNKQKVNILFDIKINMVFNYSHENNRTQLL
jgi:hypothetical protein